VVADTCNSSIQKVKARESGVGSQPDHISRTCQERENKNERERQERIRERENERERDREL
jgi:hypothetical protein